MQKNMNFPDIDFRYIQSYSENVYTYLKIRVIPSFKEVDDFKNDEMKIYEKKHGISMDELLELYDIGFKEGIMLGKKKETEMLEENKKHYWFHIASTHNISLKYYNEATKFYFREHFVTSHDPEIIKSAGRVMGEYWHVWHQILKNHSVFESLFKKEVDRIKNSFFNRPSYPYHNVRVFGIPDTMKIERDFRTTLSSLHDTYEARKNDILHKGLNYGIPPMLFRYDIWKEIKEQCYCFLEETTNNMDNEIFNKYLEEYDELREDLTTCIKTFENLRPAFEYDMTSMSPEYHRKNWFELTYELLVQTLETFDEITGIKNQIKGFKCSLPQKTIEQIYYFITGEGILKAEIEDFMSVFSTYPTIVKKPLQWLILNERGKKAGRGNQTGLYVFLKMIMGTISNEDLRKCKDIFVDEKGKFIEKKLLRPDNDKILTIGFEIPLNNILKKADQLKND